MGMPLKDKPRGVSIVIPMYNAAEHIERVINAVFGQDYGGDVELIVVNDGSRDNSLDIVKRLGGGVRFKIIDQKNSGAVAATNNGINLASHDIVCSVDSDVVLQSDWLSKIMPEFDDASVGAAQGYYKTPKGVSFWAKMMGYDVEARYDSIPGKQVTQVCTGNTAYRKTALDEVGLFDPRFKYGYDNDMSYRLQAKGYKLIFRKDALCDHYWKSNLCSYFKQQFLSGYGRLQLVNKHRDRASGDSVSGLRMILQVPATMVFFALLAAGAVAFVLFPKPVYGICWGAAAAVFAAVFLDRLLFAIGVYMKQKDAASLLLPVVHIVRNCAWVASVAAWCFAVAGKGNKEG